MDQLAPIGPVYQAGTLSGNPLAMAAGVAALEELEHGSVYKTIEETGALLESGLKDVARSAGVAVQLNRCGSMFCGYFTDRPVHNLSDAMHSDRTKFGRYFHRMLEQGIYFAPSQFEAGFISAAHTAEDIEKTVCAAREILGHMN
jgi:glutamate-1-semialdehyde 2,1-aminomutase